MSQLSWNEIRNKLQLYEELTAPLAVEKKEDKPPRSDAGPRRLGGGVRRNTKGTKGKGGGEEET